MTSRGAVPIRVERIPSGGVERVLEAADLFDRPPDRTSAREYLERDGHHLLIAYLDGEAAGFALAHELPRLDGAGPKLLLYEIGTAPELRRRGVGRSLIEAMKDLGRSLGASGLFAITEEENRAAMALYEGTGAVRKSAAEAVVEYRL